MGADQHDVRLEARESVLVVYLQRLAKRNAVNRDLSLGIEAAMDRLDGDPELRVGVLTGTPDVFCAGTDLGDLWNAKTDRGGEYGLIRRRRAKPLIAAVEGIAFGGGFEMALACDIIVASESARFAFPESQRGLVANSGGLFRAIRALPFHVARDLLLSGGEISGRRAYGLGLASRLAAPGSAVEVAVQVACDICRSSPVSIGATLEALDLQAGAADAIGWAVTDLAMRRLEHGSDTTEGIAAFLEHRKPRWADV